MPVLASTSFFPFVHSSLTDPIFWQVNVQGKIPLAYLSCLKILLTHHLSPMLNASPYPQFTHVLLSDSTSAVIIECLWIILFIYLFIFLKHSTLFSQPWFLILRAKATSSNIDSAFIAKITKATCSWGRSEVLSHADTMKSMNGNPLDLEFTQECLRKGSSRAV